MTARGSRWRPLVCVATCAPMKTLARAFANGLLIVVPSVVTVYVVVVLIRWIDDLLGVSIPGLGLVLTLAVILGIGLIASNVVGRKFVEIIERGINRLPVVKLLYNSIKDLMGAFVGDKKSFDKPVMVEILPGTRVFGFVTCEHFEDSTLAGSVAVYLPQSYNFAGNMIVVPRERVQHIDADGAQFLAFIVSGGVSKMSAAQTVLDGSVLGKVGAK